MGPNLNKRISKLKAKRDDTDPKFTPWRYFAPAELVSDEQGSGLPPSAVKEVLTITKFKNLKDLQAALKKTVRNEIPKALQSRLAKVFIIDANKKGCDRPIEVDIGRKTYKLPFPFKAAGDLSTKIVIGGFNLQNDGDVAALTFRAEISAPGMLIPRKKQLNAVCHLIAKSELTNPSDANQEVLEGWLKSENIPTSLASNSDFLDRIETAVRDRIEEIIALIGASNLVSNDDFTYVDCGEEERGLAIEG
jgi:hypothetical protein